MKNKSEMDSDDFSESEYSSEEEVAEPEIVQPKAQKSTRHLEDLKNKLGLDEFKDKAAAKREKRKRQKANRKLRKIEGSNEHVKVIETKGTKLNSKAAKIVPEVVTYVDPKKRNQGKNNHEVKMNRKDDESMSEVTMKQARFDVFKFGVKGFDKEGQHEARVALALKLGAKPEKKKCMPISELKEQRKQEREERQRQLELEKMTGMRKVSARPSSTKKSKETEAKTKAPNKKRKKSGSEATPLKLGRFDGATLKLSQKDLLKMKKKR